MYRRERTACAPRGQLLHERGVGFLGEAREEARAVRTAEVPGVLEAPMCELHVGARTSAHAFFSGQRITWPSRLPPLRLRTVNKLVAAIFTANSATVIACGLDVPAHQCTTKFTEGVHVQSALDGASFETALDGPCKPLRCVRTDTGGQCVEGYITFLHDAATTCILHATLPASPTDGPRQVPIRACAPWVESRCGAEGRLNYSLEPNGKVTVTHNYDRGAVFDVNNSVEPEEIRCPWWDAEDRDGG